MALVRTTYDPHAVEFPGASTTTGEYTFPAGRPIAVIVNAVNEVGAENPAALFSLGDTGAGLTWTKRVAKDSGGGADYEACVMIFTAIGNGTTCTLTASKSGSNLGRCLVQPYTWAGAHAVTPFGATMELFTNVTDGPVSGSLSADPAETSEVLAAICGTANGFNATAITEGAGWELRYNTHMPDYMIAMAQSRIGSSSATVAFADVLASGNGYYRAPSAVALEIIAAQTSASASAPRPARSATHFLF